MLENFQVKTPDLITEQDKRKFARSISDVIKNFCLDHDIEYTIRPYGDEYIKINNHLFNMDYSLIYQDGVAKIRACETHPDMDYNYNVVLNYDTKENFEERLTSFVSEIHYLDEEREKEIEEPELIE